MVNPIVGSYATRPEVFGCTATASSFDTQFPPPPLRRTEMMGYQIPLGLLAELLPCRKEGAGFHDGKKVLEQREFELRHHEASDSQPGPFTFAPSEILSPGWFYVGTGTHRQNLCPPVCINSCPDQY